MTVPACDRCGNWIATVPLEQKENEMHPQFELNRLAMNARPFTYDAQLDEIADRMERGDTTWTQLPVILQDRAGVYLDLRTAYRRAVAAGAIPDDRGPSAA